jgi:8-oxo-dGTP pyrophosphatase MutT (NUDIX family)
MNGGESMRPAGTVADRPAGGSAPALDSATVILVRPAAGGGGGFELYMTLRPEGMESYAGYYVFPGGKVAKQDRDPASILACEDATALRAPRLIEEAGVAGRALAHWVAAIRELFEEAGVLFAERSDGEPIDFADHAAARRLAQYRDRLQQRDVRLPALLSEEGWRLRTESLWYLCRWITPSLNPRRFDAKFFLAPLPPGQEAAGGGREVDAGMWLGPRAVIRDYERNRIKLRTPTIITLRYLAQFSTYDALVAHHADGEPKFLCIPI